MSENAAHIVAYFFLILKARVPYKLLGTPFFKPYYFFLYHQYVCIYTSLLGTDILYNTANITNYRFDTFSSCLEKSNFCKGILLCNFKIID